MTPKPPPFHSLRRLSVVGGFLDGLDIELVAGLNCIIGGRGTGKTTLLEFVRYALGMVPESQAAKKTFQGLVESNLGGGRIRLVIETKEGLSYILSRTAGEDPVVLDSKGNPTDIAPSSDSFLGVDVYSQNQVEGIADDPVSQLGLIDSFEAEPIRRDSEGIRRTLAALKTNAHECMEAQKVIGGLTDELGTLPGVEEKLGEFKATAGDDGGAVNQAHEQKAQRDRERRAAAAAEELLAEYGRETEALVGRIAQGANPIFDREAMGGQNTDAMKALRRILLDSGKEVDRLLGEAAARVKQGAAAFVAEAAKLTATHKAQDAAFSELIEKHKEAMGQSAGRAALEKRRNELLEKKKVHDQKSKALSKLLEERAALLARLSELRNHRFGLRAAVAGRISTALSPHIRVRVEQYGNTQAYQSLLETSLKSAAVQHRVVAGKIGARIFPLDLVRAAREEDVSLLVDRAEVSQDQARKVIAALAGNPVLYEIEAVELMDLPSIELLDGGEYKNSLTLSTGQKCTSVLPILLLDSEKPLLVDQPEDNLDNRFVFTTVVQRVRAVKKARQLIFITHNPNIPVLGDADRVFVMDSTGKNGRVQKAGSVDDCKREIVTILEGGEEAFKERKKRYAY